MLLPEFSFKPTKKVFWNNLKNNQMKYEPNNDLTYGHGVDLALKLNILK